MTRSVHFGPNVHGRPSDDYVFLAHHVGDLYMTSTHCGAGHPVRHDVHVSWECTNPLHNAFTLWKSAASWIAADGLWRNSVV
jgi:hypothetical protein